MITETPDNHATTAGWVFYDGECQRCLAWAKRCGSVLGQRHFRLLPLQSPEAARHLGAVDSTRLNEMKLRLADGTILGGADALMAIAHRVWWAWPLWAASRLPGVLPTLRAGYRVMAVNRHCANGACLITHRWKHLDWLPLALLPAAVLAGRSALSGWVLMWVLALAIFFGCKWLTLRRAFAGRPRPHRQAALAYLFLWPGMDAGAFLADRIAATTSNHRRKRRYKIQTERELETPHVGSGIRGSNSTTISARREWIVAITKTLTGASLLWLAITNAPAVNPTFTGWLGMIGVVVLLHFGLFHLLALFWRTTGRDVKPLMRAPLLATALADFWGKRWNTAFNTLAHDLAFRPLVRRIGVGWATLGVFLISGVIHDLVISLPARGGYGLPTAYFLLQGAAVLFERSHAGRALGLGRGGRGWLFTLLVTAAPAFWLFHPTFIHNVILPMLHAIGATCNTP